MNRSANRFMCLSPLASNPWAIIVSSTLAAKVRYFFELCKYICRNHKVWHYFSVICNCLLGKLARFCLGSWLIFV